MQTVDRYEEIEIDEKKYIIQIFEENERKEMKTWEDYNHPRWV